MQPNIPAAGKNHVLILHSRCRQNYRDFYIADMILALIRNEKRVTVCTTEKNNQSPILNLEDNNHNLNFISSWKYIPDTLYGRFELFFFQLKLFSLLISIIITPLDLSSHVIITDMSSTAVIVLRVFTRCKVLYMKHFTNLHSGEYFYDSSTSIPSSSLSSSLSYPHEIIVHTECLKNMLETCIPKINTTISVLNPCCDTGAWTYAALDVHSIVPRLPNKNFMFVVFSEFKYRSNLKLVLKAMDFILCCCTNITFNTNVHLVIAGYSQPLSTEEDAFYAVLRKFAATESFANNVTFLKQTSILQQKTLIENCTAVINPTHNNVFPGSILMAMNMKKPILSVDSGFARHVLVNRITGFLLHDHPFVFGDMMEEIARTPQIAEQVVDNAKHEFDQNYSFRAYSRQLNQIIDNHLNS